jgi:hypothetical protein
MESSARHGYDKNKMDDLFPPDCGTEVESLGILSGRLPAQFLAKMAGNELDIVSIEITNRLGTLSEPMCANVRVRPQEILDQISVLVDPDDSRQLDLFTQIQLDPESRSSRDGLITLLFLLLQQKSRHPQSNGALSARLNELVSYLQSHVALLVAIVHDPQLASLFLIGQHGSQSFTVVTWESTLHQIFRLG